MRGLFNINDINGWDSLEERSIKSSLLNIGRYRKRCQVTNTSLFSLYINIISNSPLRRPKTPIFITARIPHPSFKKKSTLHPNFHLNNPPPRSSSNAPPRPRHDPLLGYPFPHPCPFKFLKFPLPLPPPFGHRVHPPSSPTNGGGRVR